MIRLNTAQQQGLVIAGFALASFGSFLRSFVCGGLSRARPLVRSKTSGCAPDVRRCAPVMHRCVPQGSNYVVEVRTSKIYKHWDLFIIPGEMFTNPHPGLPRETTTSHLLATSSQEWAAS
jgi:hypothetical protein